MLPIRRILVPYDFSEQAVCAFRLACSLARDHGGKVILLHVDEAPAGEGSAWCPLHLERLQAEVQSIHPVEPSVPCEHRVMLGEAGQCIVNHARDENCDLVVMGTHGRTGLRRLLMGSVAEHVVRHAACPVLTVNRPFPLPAEAVEVARVEPLRAEPVQV